jgi:hypothetical protein
VRLFRFGRRHAVNQSSRLSPARVDVSLNFDTLKLNWGTKIGIFRISGINLSHLGADLSILGAKKRFRGVKYP